MESFIRGMRYHSRRHYFFSSKKGDEFFISKGVRHRIETDSLPAEILEISFGKFYEDDIVRIEDAYERV